MSGTLTHSPAVIIRQMLVDLGHGTDPADSGSWPVYATKTPDSPDAAITVLDTAGTDDGRDNHGERNEHLGIQIGVRDANHTDGWTKARAIAVALDEDVDYQGVIVSSTSYRVFAITRTSGPLAIGKEPPSAREVFTINAILALEQL